MSEILMDIPTLFGVSIDRLLMRRDFVLLMRKVLRDEGASPNHWIALNLLPGEKDA